jgi:hypothetical protein
MVQQRPISTEKAKSLRIRRTLGPAIASFRLMARRQWVRILRDRRSGSTLRRFRFSLHFDGVILGDPVKTPRRAAMSAYSHR